MKRYFKNLILISILYFIFSVIASVIAYKFKLSSGVVWFIAKAIVGLSCFIGGFVSSKISCDKKILKGMLTGAGIFLIIFFLSLVINGAEAKKSAFLIITLCITILPSMIGAAVAKVV